MRRITLLLLLFTASSVFAQPLKVQAEVDTNQIRIGEQLTLSLSAHSEKEAKIYWPVLDGNMAPFELIEAKEASKKQENDSFFYQKNYRLTSFDTGKAEIKPLYISYSFEGTETLDSIATNAIDMYVRFVEVDTSASIKPIKPIVEYPGSWRDYLPWIVLGILVIIFLMLFFWIRRKRKEVPAPKTVIKTTSRPAHEVALEKLDELEQKELWQKGEVKNYHDELSDIVRAYIEVRFRIPALESTTDELAKKMSRISLTQEQLDELHKILSIADLAKFAKVQPGRDDNLQSMDLARKFIQQTKPMEQTGDDR